MKRHNTDLKKDKFEEGKDWKQKTAFKIKGDFKGGSLISV